MADDEPKYLRRQKPVEIKRRKFGRKAWSTYLRVTLWTAVGLAGAAAAYAVGNFLLTSPQMALIHPDQISVAGNRIVAPENVREIFVVDRGKSILRVPIDKRRRQLEAIPWVEHATVRRALPNRIEVEITERTPVAFLREGDELALVDAHGVILDRPVAGDFHFPVVTGINSETPLEEREQRMQLYSKFLQEIESERASAVDQVSEVDLSDPRDVRASITGLDKDSGPVVVHFGNSDFAGKYQTLADEFGVWRAKAGRIESVDLRFSREAVVNQDTSAVALVSPKKAANALLH
ncbi:MAG TPA: FtsQ-type POTRA domain-containing protein [Candidatus Acidoferrales bacterium]|nr:FtsQ-type POTRA domain-containing protein [Candidatus Acidoferrales bacterium]